MRPFRNSVLGVALCLSAAAGCGASTPRPGDAEPEQAAPVPCQRRDITVTGQPASRTGIGSYLATPGDCIAARDTLTLAVIDRILFAGVPGSPEPRALVPDPDQARARSGQALTALFGGEWSQFVTGVRPMETGTIVTVSLDGLRRWLEQNGVARKFGLP